MTINVTAAAPTPTEGKTEAPHQPPVLPSEAFLNACALAELCTITGNVRFMPSWRVTALVTQVRERVHPAQLLAWPTRVDQCEWKTRWNNARTTVSRVYTYTPGAITLPAFDRALFSTPDN